MKKADVVMNTVVLGNKILADNKMNYEGKAALCTLIENMLMDARMYAGFNYVYWMNGGYDEWVRDGKPEDNSRYLGYEYDRHYYTNKIR